MITSILIKRIIIILALAIVSGICTGTVLADPLIPAGSTWRYLDNGSDQGTAWRQPGFDDAGWSSGPAQLGYGDGDEDTVVGYGGDPLNKYITTYFRHTFQVSNPADYTVLLLKVLRDDGCVVYLNGEEVARSNMPGTPCSRDVHFGTLAASGIGGSDESTFYEFSVDGSLLQTGDNVVAVEIHQIDCESSDISFDLQLDVHGAASLLEKGPYLLYPGVNTKMTVLWQLDDEADCCIEWRRDTTNDDGFAETTEYGDDHQHKYTIPDLTPGAKYFYRVVNGDSEYRGSFHAAPPDNAENVKFLVYGDTRSYPADHDSVAAEMIATYTIRDNAYQTIALHTGDWVNEDTEGDWSGQFFPQTQDTDNIREFIANVPINGCKGNHEDYIGGGEVFFKYWPYPFIGRDSDPTTGNWTQMTSYVTDRDIAAGDITGDGIADVASCWPGFGLYYQNGSTFGWHRITTAEYVPYSVAVGDVTGDGRAEVIGTFASGIWHWNPTTGNWTQMTSYVTDRDIAAGDITGDGIADVASCWPGFGLYYQNGSTFGWHRITTEEYVPYSVAVGDVTGDGKAEVIGTFASGIRHWNPTTGNWTQMTSYVTDRDIAAGDITGDGIADVASCWPGFGLYYQNGSTFGWHRITTEEYVPYSVAVGDVTGDIKAEVIGTFASGIWYWVEKNFYWSFDYGPVHVVVLDVLDEYDYRWSKGSDLYYNLYNNWLKPDLEETTKPWKIIILHAPGWSAGGSHPNNPVVAEDIQDLCETYGVDIVFAGHNHYYARAVVNGIQHITTGGGGAPLYDPDPNYDNVVKTEKAYHFCEIDIQGDTLSLTARDINGSEIESFSLSVAVGDVTGN